MSRARMALTLDEHLALGRALKRARALILDAAAEIRCFERLSRQLSEIAESLIDPRAQLQRKLIEQVGESGKVEGIPVREVYFGELAKEEIDGG